MPGFYPLPLAAAAWAGDRAASEVRNNPTPPDRTAPLLPHKPPPLTDPRLSPRPCPSRPRAQLSWGYSFRGARVFGAVISALVNIEGLGSPDAAELDEGPTRLMIAGCSSGARGAMYNLDYVDAILELEGLARGTVQARAGTDRLTDSLTDTRIAARRAALLKSGGAALTRDRDGGSSRLLRSAGGGPAGQRPVD